jgi:hypothetical protein
MFKSESNHQPTPNELYEIVKSGSEQAGTAFNKLSALANGGDKVSRNLIDLLDKEFSGVGVKTTDDEPKSKTDDSKTGLLQELANFALQKGFLPPDNF